MDNSSICGDGTKFIVEKWCYALKHVGRLETLPRTLKAEARRAIAKNMLDSGMDIRHTV